MRVLLVEMMRSYVSWDTLGALWLFLRHDNRISESGKIIDNGIIGLLMIPFLSRGNCRCQTLDEVRFLESSCISLRVRTSPQVVWIAALRWTATSAHLHTILVLHDLLLLVQDFYFLRERELLGYRLGDYLLSDFGRVYLILIDVLRCLITAQRLFIWD